MPFVQITLLAGRGEGYARAVGDAVNGAVIDTMDFPAEDRFQVIQEVPDYALQLQQRRGDRIMLHLVMRQGRSDAQKTLSGCDQTPGPGAGCRTGKCGHLLYRKPGCGLVVWYGEGQLSGGLITLLRASGRPILGSEVVLSF